MDIGRSFTYITEDEDWIKKVLLGGLISLIPFVGQFYLLGYTLQVLRNVIAGREIPLPDVTEDFGSKLLNGLILAVITFIYFLPVSAISACSGLGSSLIPQIAPDAEEFGTVMAAWAGCAGCLSFVLGIAGGLMLPFAWSRYAESGQFADAFKLGDNFAMLRDNIGPTIIVLLVSALAGLIASLAGTIACVVGLIFTMFYAQLINAYLYGSLYRQAHQPAL